MSFVYRLAETNDIPALKKLIPISARALQAAHYSSDQIEAALGSVFGVDSQLIRDGTYYVAEAGDKIVGCGGWSRRKTLFGGDAGKVGADPLLDPKTDPARIRAFFVDPAYARQGIGRRIMELSEAAAIAAGFRRIDIVATLAGEPLYLKFGYREVERYSIPLQHAESLPAVRLSKSVAS